MIRRPPRSTLSSSSAASDVYKRQGEPAEGSLTARARCEASRTRAATPSKPRAGVGGRRDRRDLGPPVPSRAETPLRALFFSPSGEINYPRETLKASLSPVHAGAGLPDRVPTPWLFGFARSAAGGLKFPGLTPGALGHLTPQNKTFLPVLGQNNNQKEYNS